MRLACLLVGALALAAPARAHAAPPEVGETGEQGRVVGRVLVAGTRASVPEAKVIVVAAPPNVRVGAPARDPLDPASVVWMREAMTDEDGRFAIDALPPGKLRIVVMVDGYERLELWAEASASAKELTIFLRPTQGRFRTEVLVDRNLELPRAEHRMEAARARVYPGTSGDPVRAAQNLPGVARTPGGLGLMAIRGGDPRQTGIYVDGHPVPRAFHVLPIAAVVDPSMIDYVELTPGNFDAAYGGFSGGLLELHTRRLIGLQGIHGEVHADLFDVGGAIWAPVGEGGVAVAVRRAHVGDVVKAADDLIGKTGILVPNYWDYFGRFDYPIGRRHLLSVKAFGAGDSLQDTTEFEPGQEIAINFRTAFHRFDLGYAYEGARLRASVSGALLLDTNLRDDDSFGRRNRRARTPSLRAALSYRMAKRATLLAGFDFVRTRAYRQIEYDYDDEVTEFEAKYWKLGTWLGAAFQLFPRTGVLVVRPQVRLNVFGTTSEQRVGVDPRLDLRARVHEQVEFFAALGLYSAPYSVYREDQLGLISDSTTATAHIVVPDWLINYFDPGAETETPDGVMLITRTLQASLGTQIELPWSLGLRTTLFWRERPTQSRGYQESGSTFGHVVFTLKSPRERAYGLELLLDRSLAEHVHGMIGYTLLRAQTDEVLDWFGLSSGDKWRPANFDQRHNLVTVLVFELPRHHRVGARFRLVSGNPEEPVIGTGVVQNDTGFSYYPIYGELGSSYGPLFHQLDVRIDKTWMLRHVALVAYLDVQNVYNRVYPEIWVYSADWSDRGQRIGLPIFPSLGLRLEF